MSVKERLHNTAFHEETGSFEKHACGNISTKYYFAPFTFCSTFKVKYPLTLDNIVLLFEMFMRLLFFICHFTLRSSFTFFARYIQGFGEALHLDVKLHLCILSNKHVFGSLLPSLLISSSGWWSFPTPVPFYSLYSVSCLISNRTIKLSQKGQEYKIQLNKFSV